MSPIGIPNLAGPQPLRGPGSVGPGQNPVGYNPPTQSQSAPPNTGVSIVAGIADFLKNYQAGKKAFEDTNKQDFMNDVQLMMLGIPVDHKKMAKKAKQGGMDLDFEGDNAPVVAAQNQNTQFAQGQGPAMTDTANSMAGQAMQQMLTQSGGGQMVQPGQQPPPLPQVPYGPNPGQTPMPAPGPGPQRNILQKIGDQFTGGPVNPGSPGMAWLDTLSKQGTEAARQQIEDQRQSAQMQDVRRNMLGLLSKAISGDPEALDIATRLPAPFGLKDHPFDDLRSLGMTTNAPPAETAKAIMYHALGGPQAMQHMQEMAAKFAPKFGGDMATAMKYIGDITNKGYSELKPGLSLEEETKVQDTIDKMSKLYPKAPLNLLRSYANMEFLGQKGAAREISNYLSTKYEREGKIAAEQFNTTNQWHRDELSQAAWIHSQNIDLATKRAILDATGEEGKNAWKMIEDKNASEDTKQAGYEVLASLMSKLSDIKVPITGANGKKQVMNLGTGTMTADRVRNLIRSDKYNMYNQGAGSGLNQFVGQNPGGPPSSLNQAVLGAKQGIQDWFEEQLNPAN